VQQGPLKGAVDCFVHFVELAAQRVGRWLRGAPQLASQVAPVDESGRCAQEDLEQTQLGFGQFKQLPARVAVMFEVSRAKSPTR
jgi:hypothetical protein